MLSHNDNIEGKKKLRLFDEREGSENVNTGILERANIR